MNKNWYPRGKLESSDEGAAAIAISIEGSNTVKIDFGKNIRWIGLDKATAIHLAHVLLEIANQIKEN